MFRKVAVAAAFATAFMSGSVFADTIDPATYTNNSLGVGDSVTVRKTVTVSASGPTTSPIDIMFLFDTTGSMSTGISAARTAASSILSTLSGFGTVASGTAFYGDPHSGIVSGLTTNSATTTTSIGTFAAGSPDGGGDYPEVGYDGIVAAAGASWTPGSSRFIVDLGDAGFKDSTHNASDASAALSAAGATLIGLDFCSTSGTCSLAPTFSSSITGLGGTVFASTDAASVSSAIISAVGSSFDKYSEVTVGDLGNGSPEIGLSVACVSADIGTCSGATASGSYDRTVDRSFKFDVTFTRLASGGKAFDTYGLVDGKIVATERDAFGVSTVPVPAAGWLLLAGVAGLGAMRRRRKAA